MSKVRNITPLPPANFTPEVGNYKTLQPFRYWCQKVLPLVYDDSLSYYELLCKIVDYLNKTMEDVETLHDDVINLHKVYEELQSYVNDYFSTLDVQQEINNKLDELVNSGKFDAILDNYFKKKANTYLTANDMIRDNSLTVGNFCITQGFYSVNDNGNGMYFITDTPDTEILCLKLNNGLFARLWCDNYTINLRQLGVNSSTDIGKIINNLLSIKPYKWYALYLPYGSYTLNTTIIIDGVTNFKIYGDSGSTTINCTVDAIRIYGGDKCVIEHLLFTGNTYNTGYSLSDKNFNSQKDRSGNTELNDCVFSNFLIGVNIDAPSGYNMFNRVQVNRIPEKGIAVEIGKNYNNTTGILPNFIYFTNCNFDAHATPNATCSAIVIHCGQYITFDKCDIANFMTSTAVIIDDDVNSIYDISFVNTQFFSNKNHVNVKRTTTKVFTNIRFLGCVFSSSINSANGIIAEPDYLINCFIVEGCTFIGAEASWNNMLQFNNNVTLSVNCGTNVSNPFKHNILPKIDKIIASPNWLYGKTTVTKDVEKGKSVSLTVGSSTGWKKISEVSPLTTVHNYNKNDGCQFGGITVNEDSNTATLTAYAYAENAGTIKVSLSVL